MILAWQPHDFEVLADSGVADASEKADFTQLQSVVSGEAAASADVDTVADIRLSRAYGAVTIALLTRPFRSTAKLRCAGKASSLRENITKVVSLKDSVMRTARTPRSSVHGSAPPRQCRDNLTTQSAECPIFD